MGRKSASDVTNHGTEPANKSAAKQSPNLMVIITMLLDTAWRVAVPILVLSVIGHQLDLHFKTSPRYLIAGFFLSLIMAISLVYRQLVVNFPDQFGKNKQRPVDSKSKSKTSNQTGGKS